MRSHASTGLSLLICVLLAAALSIEPPAHFRARLGHVSDNYLYAKLLWAGIAQNTRIKYLTPVRSYEGFCHASRVQPWPATVPKLAPWIVTRAFGSPLPQMGQIAASSISGYVSALRSVHVDLNLPTDVFECPHIRRLIAGAETLFPRQPRQQRLPITKQLLISLLSPRACAGEHFVDTLNLNAAFSLAFSAFLRMGEFTWADSELAHPRTFSATRPTRRCITMGDGSFDFFLPRSKTDKHKTGVTILVAASDDSLRGGPHDRPTHQPPRWERYAPLLLPQCKLFAKQGTFYAKCTSPPPRNSLWSVHRPLLPERRRAACP